MCLCFVIFLSVPFKFCWVFVLKYFRVLSNFVGSSFCNILSGLSSFVASLFCNIS